ncbi:response regulator [Chloroflexota bacterium]
MSIRILLADDHKIVREGLHSLLEKQADMEVIAEAADGRTTVRLAQEMSPDIILMDVAMPDLNGIEATRQIVANDPSIKVVALSMYSDRRFVIGVLKMGASGYLLKDCGFDELAHAIRTVTGNQIYLSPTIVDMVAKDYIHYLEKEEMSSPAFSILTAREREVLQLLVEGRTVKCIANHLHLSTKTIETYRQQVMNKIDIHTIAELTKFAIREGLTPLER